VSWAISALLKSSASSPEVTDADLDKMLDSASQNKRFDEVERAAGRNGDQV